MRSSDTHTSSHEQSEHRDDHHRILCATGACKAHMHCMAPPTTEQTCRTSQQNKNATFTTTTESPAARTCARGASLALRSRSSRGLRIRCGASSGTLLETEDRQKRSHPNTPHHTTTQHNTEHGTRSNGATVSHMPQNLRVWLPCGTWHLKTTTQHVLLGRRS